MSRDLDEAVEPDRLAGASHPRDQHAFFGHAEAVAAFAEGIKSGRLHHAWLIGGAQGIGKATLAYRVARRLLDRTARIHDSSETLAVAPDSPAARQVAALSHPNLAVLRRMPGSEKKAASATIPVDAVRRALGVFASTAADGGYRVCIVDSAEDLTIASANALLKVIEEPPPRSIFLIVSHSPQRLLATIRSRCRRLVLRPLSDKDVEAAVRSLGGDFASAPDHVLRRAIDLGEGSVRRTLEMLDDDKLAFVAGLGAALDALPQTDAKRVLALAESLARRDAEEQYELALTTVQRWLAARLNAGAALGPQRLAPLVEVCDKVTRSAREIDVYNLDRRPLVLSLFDDLAEAVRRTA
jgi:DNA polymerase-3 subunit delta'